jgi:hypothetical protein
MEYQLSSRAKMITFILMGIGLLAMILGFVNDDTAHHGRFWSNMLINGFFFFAISLGALFFLALQYVTEAAWSVALKRIFEGIIGFLPIGMVILIVVFASGTFHLHHLYHWMDPEVYNPESNHYDAIIAGKSAYLNQPFFWIRTLVYMAVFFIYAKFVRKHSLLEDQLGGTATHYKVMGKSAVFMILFAVFSSTLSWDWIMSIDTHWFSTLFGWYVFSGMWVSALIMAVLLVVYLKGKGLLEMINESHVHDLGKWMFAVSFLWSYLWFSQFMLIWYSDLGEEVIYFQQRIEHYKVLFFMTFFINFAFPMLILMSRDTKRNVIYLLPVAGIILIGHWLDVYMMVTPGVLGNHAHIGFTEIGMFLGFLGLFIFTVLKTLSKTPLMVKNHPYLEESKHFNI